MSLWTLKGHYCKREMRPKIFQHCNFRSRKIWGSFFLIEIGMESFDMSSSIKIGHLYALNPQHLDIFQPPWKLKVMYLYATHNKPSHNS